MELSKIYSTHEVAMVQDAYDAVLHADLLNWFKAFEPHPNEGFMFSSDVNLAVIGTHMKYQGHSGSSYGWTMRVVHDIVKNGWDAHKANAIATRGPACMCRRERGMLTGWCGSAGGGVPACDH